MAAIKYAIPPSYCRGALSHTVVIHKKTLPFWGQNHFVIETLVYWFNFYWCFFLGSIWRSIGLYNDMCTLNHKVQFYKCWWGIVQVKFTKMTLTESKLSYYISPKSDKNVVQQAPLLLTRRSTYIYYKVWDEITYPIPNLDGGTVKENTQPDILY